MSYITVLGAGSWGTTLARMLAEKDYDVSLWAYEKDLALEMKRSRENRWFLPGVPLPDNLTVTSSIREALDKVRYIVNAVPAQYTRSVIGKALPFVPDDSVFVSVSKGIEKDTCLTVSGIIGGLTGRPVAALSGPSFAKEVSRKLPTAVTLACGDYGTCLLLQEVFTTSYFRVYTHHDIVGVEVGGALKNIMAIASGASDGLGLGMNARAALITRGLAEMTRLGVMLGAREQTFSGLSGIGDLVLTCSSNLSRNYTVGFKLGQGMKLAEIIGSTRSVAEGVATTKAVRELAAREEVDMPIVEQVYQVLYEDKAPADAVRDLMERALKPEFHG
ncbi:MAG: NAD(P)H-dependent glycerol-3-phosphate dehydrogenase [Thermodesulfovibrionales bacterium]